MKSGEASTSSVSTVIENNAVAIVTYIGKAAINWYVDQQNSYNSDEMEIINSVRAHYESVYKVDAKKIPPNFDFIEKKNATSSTFYPVLPSSSIPLDFRSRDLGTNMVASELKDMIKALIRCHNEYQNKIFNSKAKAIGNILFWLIEKMYAFSHYDLTNANNTEEMFKFAKFVNKLVHTPKLNNESWLSKDENEVRKTIYSILDTINEHCAPVIKDIHNNLSASQLLDRMKESIKNLCHTGFTVALHIASERRVPSQVSLINIDKHYHYKKGDAEVKKYAIESESQLVSSTDPRINFTRLFARSILSRVKPGANLCEFRSSLSDRTKLALLLRNSGVVNAFKGNKEFIDNFISYCMVLEKISYLFQLISAAKTSCDNGGNLFFFILASHESKTLLDQVDSLIKRFNSSYSMLTEFSSKYIRHLKNDTNESGGEWANSYRTMVVPEEDEIRSHITDIGNTLNKLNQLHAEYAFSKDKKIEEMVDQAQHFLHSVMNFNQAIHVDAIGRTSLPRESVAMTQMMRSEVKEQNKDQEEKKSIVLTKNMTSPTNEKAVVEPSILNNSFVTFDSLPSVSWQYIDDMTIVASYKDSVCNMFLKNEDLIAPMLKYSDAEDELFLHLSEQKKKNDNHLEAYQNSYKACYELIRALEKINSDKESKSEKSHLVFHLKNELIFRQLKYIQLFIKNAPSKSNEFNEYVKELNTLFKANADDCNIDERTKHICGQSIDTLLNALLRGAFDDESKTITDDKATNLPRSNPINININGQRRSTIPMLMPSSAPEASRLTYLYEQKEGKTEREYKENVQPTAPVYSLIQLTPQPRIAWEYCKAEKLIQDKVCNYSILSSGKIFRECDDYITTEIDLIKLCQAKIGPNPFIDYKAIYKENNQAYVNLDKVLSTYRDDNRISPEIAQFIYLLQLELAHRQVRFIEILSRDSLCTNDELHGRANYLITEWNKASSECIGKHGIKDKFGHHLRKITEELSDLDTRFKKSKPRIEKVRNSLFGRSSRSSALAKNRSNSASQLSSMPITNEDKEARASLDAHENNDEPIDQATQSEIKPETKSINPQDEKIAGSTALVPRADDILSLTKKYTALVEKNELFLFKIDQKAKNMHLTKDPYNPSVVLTLKDLKGEKLSRGHFIQDLYDLLLEFKEEIAQPSLPSDAAIEIKKEQPNSPSNAELESKEGQANLGQNHTSETKLNKALFFRKLDLILAPPNKAKKKESDAKESENTVEKPNLNTRDAKIALHYQQLLQCLSFLTEGETCNEGADTVAKLVNVSIEHVLSLARNMWMHEYENTFARKFYKKLIKIVECEEVMEDGDKSKELNALKNQILKYKKIDKSKGTDTMLQIQKNDKLEKEISDINLIRKEQETVIRKKVDEIKSKNNEITALKNELNRYKFVYETPSKNTGSLHSQLNNLSNDNTLQIELNKYRGSK